MMSPKMFQTCAVLAWFGMKAHPNVFWLVLVAALIRYWIGGPIDGPISCLLGREHPICHRINHWLSRGAS
jgi:hypothetical protein